MHKCIGFVVPSVAVSSLAASKCFCRTIIEWNVRTGFEQVLRTCFRTRIFELVCLNVSVFECFRTRIFELVFSNVSVFARMFELVVSSVFERECSS